MAKQVIVYHQPGCGPCHQAMEFLKQQKVPFVSKDVATDPTASEELMALGSMSTPTIVVDGKTIVGFRPQQLLDLLKA